ncbi:MAG: SH3 domain-containing protein [Eubacteriales bacterium]|nr:SH3 domain-containing protein [Eubacteriales bacterium]
MQRCLKKALCTVLSLCFLICLFPFATLAESKTGYVKAGTPLSANVCSDVGCGWQVVGSLPAGEVTITSEQEGYYFVSMGGRQGFVYKTDISFTPPAATATTAAASTTTKSASSSSTKKSSVTYGHVVNCEEWVNINRKAEKDALGKVYKNDLLAILGTSGEYTKVKTMKNTTGYVKSSYIEKGLLSKGDDVFSNPFKVKSTQKNIWLRNTPVASSSGSNVNRKLSDMMDKEFLAVAENEDWYLLKYEDCTGYGRKEDFTKVK